MKYTYITRTGEIIKATMKEISTIKGKLPTWTDMHNLSVGYMDETEKLFLERYGQQKTIFNVANLRRYGAIQLYPHWINIALRNGAIDKRVKQ